MARYKSILQFQGSIDGLVFYELNGVSVVRKKSGFNRDDFKTKENYARVEKIAVSLGIVLKRGKCSEMPFILIIKNVAIDIYIRNLHN